MNTFCGQEPSLVARDWAKARTAYKPRSLHLSSLDLEAEQALGGIFALRRDRREHLRPQAGGHRLKELNGAGRAHLYAMDLAKDIVVLVYNLYGWTNGATDPHAAARTDDMLSAIVDDAQAHPSPLGPSSSWATSTVASATSPS